MDDETINAIFDKLNEAQRILTEDIPLPDMDVSEWNATPIGRAVGCIQDVLELIEDAP